MSFVPDPLHPAVVHFPVVLIVLGCLAAWAAVFLRKGNVPWFAAGLLVLGAASAWAAKETGKSDGGLLDSLTPQTELLLDAHQYWAEKTVAAATVTAMMAIAAAALVRSPRLARSLAVAAALAASVAAWTVYETGHRGGALVFEHGTGVHARPLPASSGNNDQTVASKALSQFNPGETD